MRYLVQLTLSLALASSASAGTMEIAYRSVESMLVRGLLTEGGRLYLQGGPADECNYAFVQDPRVSATGGRLEVKLLFAGSLGKEVRGKCVGTGDNFDVVVSGLPRYASGELFLDEMTFAAESKVFNLFAPIVESQLRERLRVPLRRTIDRQLAEWSALGAGRITLQELDVSSIQLGEDRLTIKADYKVALEVPWCTTRDLGPQLSCTHGFEVPHEHFQTHSAEVCEEGLSREELA